MGTNRALRYIIVVIGASVFFLLASTPADAKTPYDPLGPLSTNPIVKIVGNYLGKNSTLNATLFGTHVTCGGGDQTKINLGPIIQNVSDCNECEGLAACAGQKKGVSNVGYLWDAHTNQCGLGIPVTETEARSCEEEDTCLGVDEARFREIKDDVLGAVDAVKNLKDLVSGNPYFEADDIAPADSLLALTWVESKWDTLYGNTTYNSNLPFSCSGEEATLNQMCSDINFRLKIVDKHGKECKEMPISGDPDGAEPICDGKMGFAQILPSTYLAKTFFGGTDQCIVECGAAGGELVICVGICQSKNLIGEVTGELYPDPWNQHDGIYAAETILTLRHAEFDGSACVTACVAGGGLIDSCLSSCDLKRDRCAIINYHFGAGACEAELPDKTTIDNFYNEVLKYKPVMQSLLDSGTCPGGPGPGGPLPSPCPPESAGAATLTSYISNTYNIHFDGPWSAGTLYDVCQKLYETSGTQFDDFFRNDPDGATVTTNYVAFFCQVTGKMVNCGIGTGLHDARRSMATFNIFHELGHTIKAMDGVGLGGSGEGQMGSVAASDHAKTIWNDGTYGHISIYPWNVHDAGNTCFTFSWEGEQYADTVGYYFHPGLHQISPSCAGAPDSRVPYKDTSSPAHCQLMKDKMGSYNPFCATTLGTWQIHSSVCDATDAGSCQASLMLQFFDTHAADAVQICRRESGGNALILNDGCLTGETYDYSVGLFQINLLAHCKDEDGDGTKPFSLNNPFCAITDQDDVDICMKKFGYGDPIANSAKALEIAQAWGGFGSGGTGWCPWSTASPSNCALCPHP